MEIDFNKLLGLATIVSLPALLSTLNLPPCSWAAIVLRVCRNRSREDKIDFNVSRSAFYYGVKISLYNGSFSKAIKYDKALEYPANTESFNSEAVF
jgi:hypothetical protein